MGTYSTYKPEYEALAIEILSQGKSLAAVCAKIGVCRDTLYDWRDKYPGFAKALKTGLQQAQSVWEDIGTQGITGQHEKFAGTPWMFVMKNRFREDYADDKKEDKASAAESVLEQILSGKIQVNAK